MRDRRHHSPRRPAADRHDGRRHLRHHRRRHPARRRHDDRRRAAPRRRRPRRALQQRHLGASRRADSTRITANKLLVMIDGRTVYSPLFAGIFWNIVGLRARRHRSHRGHPRARGRRCGAPTPSTASSTSSRATRATRRAACVSSGRGTRGSARLPRHATGGGAGRVTWRVYGQVRRPRRPAAGHERPGSGDARRRGQVGLPRRRRHAGGIDLAAEGRCVSQPRRPVGPARPASSPSSALQAAGRSRFGGLPPRHSVLLPPRVSAGPHAADPSHRHLDVDAQHAATSAGGTHVVWGAGVRVNRDETHASATLSFNPRTAVCSSAASSRRTTSRSCHRACSSPSAPSTSTTPSAAASSSRTSAPAISCRADQIVWGAVSRAVRRPTRFDDDIVVCGAGRHGARRRHRTISRPNRSSRGNRLPHPACRRCSPSTSPRLHASHRRSPQPGCCRSRACRSSSATRLEGRRPRRRSSAINSADCTGGARMSATRGWTRRSEAPRKPRCRPAARRRRTIPITSSDSVRSSLNLPHRIELDAMLRAVAALTESVVALRRPGYAELNLRAGWWATSRAELWVAGQDLLHDRHPEFGPLQHRATSSSARVRVRQSA